MPLTRAELDVTDESRVRAGVAEVRPGVIVNCAAYKRRRRCGGRRGRRAGGQRVRRPVAGARAAAAIDATLVHYGTDFRLRRDRVRALPRRRRAHPPERLRRVQAAGGLVRAGGARAYVLRVESPVRRWGAGAGRGRPPPRRSLDRIADALLEGREVRAFVDRVVFAEPCRRRRRHGRAAAGGGSARAVPLRRVRARTWFEVATELANRLGIEPAIRGITLDELELRAPRPRFCALSNRKLAAAGIEMPHWRTRWRATAGIRLRFGPG